jgi:hypothetical protein
MLLDAGVDVRFADLPQIEGTAGRFMLKQMALVAELEAAFISDRTKAAVAAGWFSCWRQAHREGPPEGRGRQCRGRRCARGGPCGDVQDLRRYCSVVAAPQRRTHAARVHPLWGEDRLPARDQSGELFFGAGARSDLAAKWPHGGRVQRAAASVA